MPSEVRLSNIAFCTLETGVRKASGKPTVSVAPKSETTKPLPVATPKISQNEGMAVFAMRLALATSGETWICAKAWRADPGATGRDRPACTMFTGLCHEFLNAILEIVLPGFIHYTKLSRVRILTHIIKF